MSKGRPKKNEEEKRTNQVRIRLNDMEKMQLENRAKRENMSVSKFARTKLLSNEGSLDRAIYAHLMKVNQAIEVFREKTKNERRVDLQDMRNTLNSIDETYKAIAQEFNDRKDT